VRFFRRQIKDLEATEAAKVQEVRYASEHAKVKQTWMRTSESIRRLDLLEVEVKLMGRGV
jgi:hypothetical protein